MASRNTQASEASKANIDRWSRDRIYDLFSKRDGATCRLDDPLLLPPLPAFRDPLDDPLDLLDPLLRFRDPDDLLPPLPDLDPLLRFRLLPFR
ncbi:unnamed protein product [Rotaria sordida]|uniref:Uncharacterized protein n=1 Tax=Rotaria sordida TaxID=392033 RepID=A0A815A9M1_9BILA|nr:unnamed protein product [Rotaria sordida]